MQTIEGVRREVVVQASQQRAFDVFAREMTTWWRADHHIGGAPIEEIVIEPREGGRWYTRHQDGTETSTGYVSVWEPPDRLALVWQISADWAFDPTLVTTVELRFIAEAPSRTRVQLEHRGLENYGPAADRMRQAFDAPDGWGAGLAEYVTTVAG